MEYISQIEQEPVNDGTEWLAFIGAKNKGTSNIQNQVFSETYSKLSFKFSFHRTEWGKREATSLFVQE